jgi:predicted metalloendopeptidase
MNHNAIYTLYPTVVTVNDTTGAFDAQGNKVEIDMALVDAWVDPDTYKFQRAAEYPSITDQLDKIFHDGIDEWKETIQAVKTKYPKP